MRKIILFSIILQLLSYHISRVESLIGENLIPIRYGEFPFVATFQYFPREINFCGGALITKKHVITLAICLDDNSPESFRILFEVANVEGPVLTYRAASWTKYIDWAPTQNISNEATDALGPAIVTLTDKVSNINPVPLNTLTKRQLDGKTAKMIGWRLDVLSKATVQLLSGEDCERSYRALRNYPPAFDDALLCSAANPFALLSIGDMGSPLLHARDNSLLGIAFGYGPDDQFVNRNFSTDFIRQHQINIHVSVHYYRLFIYSVIPAEPGA